MWYFVFSFASKLRASWVIAIGFESLRPNTNYLFVLFASFAVNRTLAD